METMGRSAPRPTRRSSPQPTTGFDAELGWGSIPNLLTLDEVAQIVAGCNRLLDLPPEQRFARDDAYSGTRHLERLDERLASVADLVARPALTAAVAVARSETGATPFGLDQAAYRCPQPGFGAQALHIDADPTHARDYVTVIVALTEFTETNGATRIVPGSQRRPDLWRSAATHDTHRDEVLLTGSAGTAFVLAGGLLHSGTRNSSASERPALQLTWRGAQPQRA